MKKLFDEQKRHLNYFFEKVDLGKTKKILQRLMDCKGTIIFSGVGKSGIIANKLAMTVVSTGSKACFLPPVSALHGDIGMVGEKDVFVCLSKSGETRELLNLVPYIRRKRADLISIVSHPSSTLAKLSDLCIYLPFKRELCPFNLAPTTSAAIQLIFGDILAIALMQAKNFTLDDYAINHPAGSIGKKITLRVRDLMFTEDKIPLCRRNDLVIDILHKLSSKGCGCLIVVDDNLHLQGIFTDGDLRRAIEKEREGFLEEKISKFMTTTPKWIEPDTLAIDAMKQMEENRLITVLPVIEDLKVVGIIRMHDIIQAGLK